MNISQFSRQENQRGGEGGGGHLGGLSIPHMYPVNFSFKYLASTKFYFFPA